jgi:hypothetical protein
VIHDSLAKIRHTRDQNPPGAREAFVRRLPVTGRADQHPSLCGVFPPARRGLAFFESMAAEAEDDDEEWEEIRE